MGEHLMNDAAVMADLEHGGADRVSVLDLYDRWEAQHWQIQHLDIAGDISAWRSMNRYFRVAAIAAMARFSEGEMAVTETLAPIAYAAPVAEYRLYLSTQIADEARHALFFRKYLAALCDNDLTTDSDISAYRAGTLFDEALARVTDRVRSHPGDIPSWYEAVVVYHLLVEGTVAMTGLHALLRMTREFPALAALHTGLMGVARDESRHVNFGMLALRSGVRTGFANDIVDALTRHLPVAAETMVDPYTEDRTPRLPLLAARRAEELRERWQFAESTLARRLPSLGLPEQTVQSLVHLWREGCAHAVATYQEVHGHTHPASYKPIFG
ncbi:ribonucleotide-diphosphate reductase subunit beta [Nocardia sp. bgisy134]|uniref:ribonucleotide-diphosphate reductase subunit beta n=1 Tax=Nocardia sp. bgisy134 TaxID=3413789 RepID=UPI003D72BC1F